MKLPESQSAFVRGFIDDELDRLLPGVVVALSQSAFVRGFIDDSKRAVADEYDGLVSIRVRARLHR